MMRTVAACVFVMACGGSAPTEELINARNAYKKAETSGARETAPERLLTARQALDRAEETHKDEPGSEEEKTRAYLAERRAQLAEAWASLRGARAAYATARRDYLAELERRQQATQEELASARSDLNRARDALNLERQARLEAEAKAQAALKSLEEIAKVKKESRGTVITLKGSVLFRSGGSNLLPAARDQLAKVAAAVRDQGKGRSIVVLGHTDARGSERSNRRLSQRRADAVRRYLVSQGLDSFAVRAEGRGEEEPIADNRTAAGRAANRRVEIVVGGKL